MKAVEALSLVAGHVDEELLKRNEYLADDTGDVTCRERLGGLLKFYYREAA